MTSLKNDKILDKLQKHIGVKELIAYYVSSLVGVGILIIPAIAAQIAGPASILAWILLALISIPFATTFAKMAILVPDSGGVPAFIEKMLSSTLGKSTGVLLTLTMVIGNPVMGFTTAHYLKAILGFKEYFIPWVAYAFMVLSLTFNFLGVRLSSKLQTYMLFFLILSLMVIMILSLPKTDFHNMQPFFSKGVLSVGAAMVVCFFSFMGWENVSSIAEEVKHPEYAFRKAIPWAIVSVGGLYTLVAWVYLSVAPANLKAGDPTVLSPILRTVFGDNTAITGNLVAIILLVLATNAWVLGASRQVFSLARNKVIPETFAHLSAHSKVPTRALLFLVVGYGFVTICIAKAGWAEEGLIKLANANFILIYFIAFFAALRVFTSKVMKFCAWLAMIATISFVPFLEWIIFVPICLTGIFYIWLRYLPKTSMQTSLSRDPD